MQGGRDPTRQVAAAGRGVLLSQLPVPSARFVTALMLDGPFALLGGFAEPVEPVKGLGGL